MVDSANVTFTTSAPCVCATGCGCSVSIRQIKKRQRDDDSDNGALRYRRLMAEGQTEYRRSIACASCFDFALSLLKMTIPVNGKVHS